MMEHAGRDSACGTVQQSTESAARVRQASGVCVAPANLGCWGTATGGAKRPQQRLQHTWGPRPLIVLVSLCVRAAVERRQFILPTLLL